MEDKVSARAYGELPAGARNAARNVPFIVASRRWKRLFKQDTRLVFTAIFTAD